jgi:methanogen homoaconitase large subunit
MGLTLSEQIFSHAAQRTVRAGDFIILEPDVVMSHDSLTPSIIKIMQQSLQMDRVKNPDQLVIVIDHVAPASTVAIADSQNLIRSFAQEQGIRFHDVGRGICHQVLVEEGIAAPGKIVIGSDSHSTSYGAVGAFGCGMGSTDIALIWASGKTWMRAPKTIRVLVEGRFQPYVSAKDLALKLCKELTIAGANYMTVEYHGLDWMRLDERQTISSMAIEVGAKAGIFPPIGEIFDPSAVPEWLFIDPEAEYARTLHINLAELEPQIALPHAVDHVVNLSETIGTRINQVFLGTCTNARYPDLKIAAELLSGQQIAKDVRLIVTPASSRELQRAASDGVLAALVNAGATITTPGCGMCMGRHQGTLGENDVCLSTGNRNFRGRMGAASSQIYLVSPAVAAVSAITGVISDPREWSTACL